MATTEQLVQLKNLVVETEYDDTALHELIDTLGVNTAAARIWREKAASTATLIDISEGSSRRNLSAIHKQALSLADYFTGLAEVERPSAARATRTRQIVRPS